MSPTIVVVVDGDFTVMRSGSHFRTAEMLRLLEKGFPTVLVYSFSNHETLSWGDASTERFRLAYPGIKLVLEARPPELWLASRVRSKLLALFPGQARKLLRLKMSPRTPLYAKLRAEPDTWFIMHFADALNRMNGVTVDNCIIDMHDLVFLNKARALGLPVFSMAIFGKLRAEFGVLRASRACISISQSESRILASLLPEARTLTIPLFTHEPNFEHPRADDELELDLVFVGSEYPFNADGLLRFLQPNIPWLAEFRIGVAGLVCNDQRVIAFASRQPSIKLFGYVENIRAFLGSAKLSISPVQGTGMKIKIIDSILSGTPVLASPESMEGLPPGYEGAVLPLTRENVEKLARDQTSRAVARLEVMRYSALLSERKDLGELLRLLKSSPRR